MVQAKFKIYMQNRFADTARKTAHVYIVGKDRVEIESMFLSECDGNYLVCSFAFEISILHYVSD